MLRRLVRSDPSTLTKTRAWRRSADVSTPVTVTKPIRGSLSSPMLSDRTSLTASFTRRRRSVIEAHDLPLAEAELERLLGEVPLRAVEQLLDLAMPARHA